MGPWSRLTLNAKRRSATLTTSLALVLIVSGCASGGQISQTNTGSSTCPRTGGTFVIATEEEPATLTTQAAGSSTTSGRVERIIQSTLVNVGPDWQIRPQLAEKWEISSDGLTYTFHLNPKAKWTDGQPVTAADAEFTWKVLGQSNANGLMDRIASATAQDDHTFVVKLKSPFAGYLVSLGNENDYWTMLPKHVLENSISQGFVSPSSPFNTTPVSSGAFMVKDWVKGDHITLARNPNYYLAGQPCLDKIVMKFTPDPAARNIAFRAGELDFLWSYMIPFQDFAYYQSNPKFKVVAGGLGVATSDFLVFNVQNKYLQNKSVRQAIAYAIDRNDYLQKANFGAGKVAHSIINSTLSQFYTAQYDQYNLDTAKANSLLDQAGYPKGANGTRFTVKLRVRPDRAFEGRGADIIKSRLKDIGIDVQLQPSDAASLYTQTYTKFDFDMVIQLRTTGPDPASNIPSLIGKVGIGQIAANGGKYVNPQLESLFAQDAQAVTVDQRKPIWDQVQKIELDEMPWLPLFEFPNYQLTSAKFANVVAGELDYQGNYATTYQAQ